MDEPCLNDECRCGMINCKHSFSSQSYLYTPMTQGGTLYSVSSGSNKLTEKFRQILRFVFELPALALFLVEPEKRKIPDEQEEMIGQLSYG
jgi:hypothetical protein